MTQNWRALIGPYGIWRSVNLVTPGLAAKVEGLGYGALWLGGSPSADLKIVDSLLAATNELVVATSIVNIWQSDAHDVAASFKRIESAHPGRFLLGIGIGHREATKEYASPYQTTVTYLDALLAEDVPAESLILAALGPKMLRLAAERTAGANPYLVTPHYVAHARETLGAGPLLAVEHKVVIESDPVAARAIGRPRVHRPYLGLQNYLNNLRRLGWTDDDLADQGSDALIDALVAHGDAGAVARQLGDFTAAGADHVCVQLVTESPDEDPVPGYRALADVLEFD
ncbi:MAG TPA: LLM class F420-dependent oxidoreductase [Streptosporangiaceae bacterium]|nr:LLM class F420-dependent oxidoreductase [Streptosporangiaceae bacterium]